MTIQDEMAYNEMKTGITLYNEVTYMGEKMLVTDIAVINGEWFICLDFDDYISLEIIENN